MFDGIFEWLIKAAGHKYLRRIPTGNPKRKWTYVYAKDSKHHDRDFHQGEKIKLTHGEKVGHYEVKSTHGDYVTLHHDETGHEVSVHRDKLAQMFSDEHHAKPGKAAIPAKKAHQASQVAQDAGTSDGHRTAAAAHHKAADLGAEHAALHRKLSVAHKRAAETIDAQAKIAKDKERKARPTKFVIKLTKPPKPGYLGNKDQAWDALMGELRDELPQGHVIANQRYEAWRGEAASGRRATKQEAKWGAKSRPGRAPKPGPWKGGELDSLNRELDRKAPDRGERMRGVKDRRVSSLREGFDKITAGIKRWDDPRMKGVLEALREVPGLESIRLPGDEVERQTSRIDKEAEAYYREQQEAQGVDTSFDPDEGEADPDFDDDFDFGFNVVEATKSMNGIDAIGEYEELAKSKFIERTGVPGNYKYKYRTPDGQTVTVASRGANDPKKAEARKKYSKLAQEANKHAHMGGDSIYDQHAHMNLAAKAQRRAVDAAQGTHDPSTITRAKEDLDKYTMFSENLSNHVRSGTKKVAELFAQYRDKGEISVSLDKLAEDSHFPMGKKIVQAGLDNLGYEVENGKIHFSRGKGDPDEGGRLSDKAKREKFGTTDKQQAASEAAAQAPLSGATKISSKGSEMAAMFGRMKGGEGLVTKDMAKIGAGHGISAQEAKAVMDQKVKDGTMIENSEGYHRAGGDPPSGVKPMKAKKSLDAIDELRKSLEKGEGEGSRGGKIIGHTASGKAIYGSASHPSHANFTRQDHQDAENLHGKKHGAAHGAAMDRLDQHPDHKDRGVPITHAHIKDEMTPAETAQAAHHKQQQGIHMTKKTMAARKSMDSIENLEAFTKGGATVGETTTCAPQKDFGDAGALPGDNAAGAGALPHGENKGDGGSMGAGESGRPPAPPGSGGTAAGKLSEDDEEAEVQMKDRPGPLDLRAGQQVMAGRWRKSEMPAGARMTPGVQAESQAHERAVAISQLNKSDDIAIGVGVEPGGENGQEVFEKAQHQRVGDLVHMSNVSDIEVERYQKSGQGFYQGGAPALDTTGDLMKSKPCVGGGNHLMAAHLSTCDRCGAGSSLGVRGVGLTMLKSGRGLVRPFEADLDLSKGLSIEIEEEDEDENGKENGKKKKNKPAED